MLTWLRVHCMIGGKERSAVEVDSALLKASEPRSST